jgi:hypothetical protein
MMAEYYNANFASLHVRVSNRAALHMYKDNLGFEILGIEKGYYADKEDAYKMKKFFKEEDKTKEQSKFIQISSDVKWEDIKDTYEEVDVNGEEKTDDKEEKKDDQEPEDDKKDEEGKKKKKKKNKKK